VDEEEEFRALLDAGRAEQEYQAFLERHSRFVPREFVQNHGIHANLVVRKLAMARDYTSDLFYIAKSSGDTNFVFVELEKPSGRLFKRNNEFHADLLKGLDQVDRWRAWLSNRANLEGFVNGTVKWLQTYGMRDNPVYMKFVLVIGRRAEVAQNDLRRNLLAAKEREDFKIVSYDSLLEDVASKRPLYVGVRRNEYIEIESTVYAGEGLFSLVPPERLRINQSLRDDVLAHRSEWREIVALTPRTFMLDRLLPKVGTVV
jgi:Domain of unknown function (DUF4263)